MYSCVSRLHSLLTSDLGPDYRNLVTQLSELEVIRCIDPELLKVRDQCPVSGSGHWPENVYSIDNLCEGQEDKPEGHGDGDDVPVASPREHIRARPLPRPQPPHQRLQARVHRT